MLEIKNLTKIYKTKGGDTRALDDVSIKFPDRGMVFLLGKSGSGKSTLLNVCGGLDTPTSGEIIVKGRSSSTFSGSDFDSYRNTFIGFIFQEYNILNEFSVEANIALALELQGKPVDKKKIHELLAQVELEKFAKRKPNTLSGGQKQRIAIARALIKDPEIIMADEPTGALDSNTGRQVLETLKKLSETKLVIVVSHDREFAECYGDRIIELMDGKILSDVSKEEILARKSGNITFIDDNTVSIDSGAQLSADDLDTLNEFLKQADSEVLISKDKKEIGNYKKLSRISDNGTKEAFIDTKEENIVMREYTAEDGKLIKSKLPLKHASKIGVSNLRLKPIRLIFTILLAVVSFVMLGIVSTMTFYDSEQVTVESLANYDNKFLSIKKVYNATIKYDEDYLYTNTADTNISDSDLAVLREKYGDDTVFYYDFSPVNTDPEMYFYGDLLSISNLASGNSNYYSGMAIGFAAVGSNHTLAKERLLAGGYPTSDNQVMISSYTFESIKAFGLKDSNGQDVGTINSYSDVINKKIMFSNSNAEFVICGVYNVDDLIPAKYKELINETSVVTMDSYYWEQERAEGVYTLMLVSNGFYDANVSKFMTNVYQSAGTYTEAPISLEKIDSTVHQIDKISNQKVYGFDGKLMDGSFAENDVSVSIGMFFNAVHNNIDSVLNSSEKANEEWYGIYDEQTQTNRMGILQKLEYAMSGRRPVDSSKERGVSVEVQKPSIPSGDASIEYVDDVEMLSLDERLAYFREVCEFLERYEFLDEITRNLTMSQYDTGEEARVNVVGVMFTENSYIAMSEEMFDKVYFTYGQNHRVIETKYTVDTNAKFKGAFVYNSGDILKLRELVANAEQFGDDDSTFKIRGSVIDTINTVNEFVEVCKIIFLWAGIIFALFSTLLLFNFISVSIVNKQREIGILRAVGARGTDVFKIFFSESAVIVAICFIISVIISLITCNAINNVMGEGLGGVRLFVFGPASFALVALLSAVVSVVSTFLPVYRIAKKKPVESIKAL